MSARGDAETLYHSVHDRLYALPGETRVFVSGRRFLRLPVNLGVATLDDGSR